jgi:ABC-type methionine transport system ATPase subunit
VIVTAYPVRGLDINSSYAIYNILNRQKEKGVGVLFVGEDLDVMLELCDRIVVLCHGRITGIVDAKETSKEELGLLMTDALMKKESTKEYEEILEETEEPEEVFEPSVPAKVQEKKIRQPLFRIAKRDNLSSGKILLLYMIAILAAVVAGGILVSVMGVNPFAYYKTVVTGCFENEIYFKGFIRIVIPLTITSLGIAFAFK